MLFFPNPNNGIFSVEADLNISRIEVFNTLGKLIYSENISTKKSTINLSNQSKGVYFYRLKIDDKAIKTGRIFLEK